MSAVAPLVLAFWVVSALVVWLLGWESAAPHPESRGRIHRAIEIHLALWAFFALGVRFVTTIFPSTPPAAAALLVLAFGPMAAALLAHGRRQGGTALPRGAVWFLAPLRGVSLWLLLGYEALRRRLPAPRPVREESSREEEPTSPRSLRQAVHELDELTLEEIMVPRSQVAALSGDLTPREVLTQVRAERHSLYPVHGDSVDHLLGLVRMLDLGQPGQADRPIKDLVAPAPIFPETMRGLDLLDELVGRRLGAALVVDEFGSHAGLVTTEDLVEILVGDLVGEHEVVRRRILPLGAGRYRVEGVCEIEEFNEEVGEVLPEGEYETIAGLVLEHTGRIPQTGDEIEVPGALLEVEEVTDRRILWVRVTVTAAAGEGASRP